MDSAYMNRLDGIIIREDSGCGGISRIIHEHV